MVGAPRVNAQRGARCLMCHKLVQYEAIVEGYPGQTTFCKYLVRCHGQEELRTYDMGSTEWEWEDVRSWRDRAHWFDPGSFDAAPLGKDAGNVNDYEDPERKKLYSDVVLASERGKISGGGDA